MSRARPALLVGAAVAVAALLAGSAAALLLAGTPQPWVPRPAAQPSPPGPQPTTSPGPAETLLERAAAAGHDQPYSGTEYLTSWSAAGTSSVIVHLDHVPGSGVWVRVEGGSLAPGGSTTGGAAPGGSAGTGATALVGDPAAGGLDPRALAALERHYTVLVAGPGRCAGRAATVVEVRRRPDGRIAGRLWIDDQTGLLLRRELYDDAGRMVRAAAFVDVAMTATAPNAMSSAGKVVAPSPGRPVSAGGLAGLRADGWAVPPALPGGLELYDARLLGSGPAQVLHLSYSDGLFAVSVFAQRGRLNPAGWQPTRVAGQPVYGRGGLTRQLTWSDGRWVYTVVADAPDDLVAGTVAALPHAAADSLSTRLARGVRKMTAWLR